MSSTSLAEKVVPVGLYDLFFQFLLIGAVSFGGGIIAYERILLIEKKRWLTADEFMGYLAISQTMPGLNSVNLAVLAGDHLRGALGAFVATIGLILPGSLFVLIIGVAYTTNTDHPLANLILSGVAAAACGLLAAITYRIGDDHWKHLKSLFIIVPTFILMSFIKLSLPIVLLIMAPIAIYIYRPKVSS
ncbi:chromate transporter [Polynucleobacter sp. UK-Gri1-W3]|jgi:chromate transporter|uniref:chromate transporter n=1 Tax=Polynucleobacter sp. UK-Gri1-W3 TaxID=1819737 RepID=UPI001C0E12DC|nr:chromate transporter [Polynucleobacter sp. UK-Gri1-W3]MBU3539149.1 chromate transporter [Polynucleobacter sp. UK-Gri1-W3]